MSRASWAAGLGCPPEGIGSRGGGREGGIAGSGDAGARAAGCAGSWFALRPETLPFALELLAEARAVGAEESTAEETGDRADARALRPRIAAEYALTGGVGGAVVAVEKALTFIGRCAKVVEKLDGIAADGRRPVNGEAGAGAMDEGASPHDDEVSEAISGAVSWRGEDSGLLQPKSGGANG